MTNINNYLQITLALVELFNYSSDIPTSNEETKMNLPTPGQRVGVVCGPGESARDTAGMTLTHVETRWGTHALVMMDSGKLQRCEGLNDGPGIGWHAVPQ